MCVAGWAAKTRIFLLALGSIIAVGLSTGIGLAQTDGDPDSVAAEDDIMPQLAAEPETPPYLLTIPEPERGRRLFVSKGCVVCHSLNGVGGEVGPPLDPDPYQSYIDPLEFVAGMWRGATAMIVLQEMELGYQIDLSGSDIAHIAGFLHNWDEVQAFGEEDVPEFVRRWMEEETLQRLEEGMVDE